MSPARVMIEVENLSKSYGGQRAVDGISFEVRTGEVVGFLGPNGAGKSTTMKILTTFIAPTAGTARLGGQDVVEESLAARRYVGYLPEDTPVYEEMTTLELLQFAAALRRIELKQRDRRIRRIAGLCGLLDVLGQPVGELSKGYRQRVGLAQAMVHDPPILILDEPTSGLDPNQIVEIRELIKEIGRERTVVLSTHILPEVQATCGRVIIIHEGKIVADGSPDTLTRRDQEAGVRLIVEAHGTRPEEVAERLGRITGVERVAVSEGEDGVLAFVVAGGTSDRDLRRDLFACVRDSGWVLLEMRRQAPTLEDVFRRLTRE